MTESKVPQPICQNFPSTKFRLVSYNILAQAYMKPDYYSYCPLDCLDPDNRSMATLTLLRQLQADFLCLQELDMYDFYSKELETDGYSNVYIRRSNYKLDGCGIFYKHDLVELLIQESIKYNDIEKDYYVDDFKLVNDCVGIMASFRFKGTNHIVIVANTHLYWNPAWSHIKFAQAQYLAKRLGGFKALVSEKYGCEEPFLIVAGDFNSFPSSKVYQYLISGCSSYYEWCKANNEVVGCFTDLHCEEPPVPLCSVYGFATGREPKFTNCKPTFKETLDYIFFSPSEGIKPVSVLKLPDSEEEPDVAGGLPNSYHPSDHLPIAAEFEII